MESVRLSVSVSTGAAAAAFLKRAYPAAKIRGGVFQITMVGETPAEIAQEARGLLEKIRLATAGPKEFK